MMLVPRRSLLAALALRHRSKRGQRDHQEEEAIDGLFLKTLTEATW